MSVPIGPKRTSEVGVWSPEKLEILRCYLGQRSGFLQASKSAAQRHYIDLFAGPGQNRVRGTNNTFDGSPLVATRAGPPSFTHLYWVDANPGCTASLQMHRSEHADRNIRVYEGDANARIDDILLHLPKFYPAFAFLDPLGTELHWQTVSKLARHKTGSRTKIELFVLFPYNHGIARLMPHDPQQMVNEEALDRFMPDPLKWREAYRLRAALKAAEFRRRMLDEYVNGLRLLGYRFVPVSGGTKGPTVVFSRLRQRSPGWAEHHGLVPQPRSGNSPAAQLPPVHAAILTDGAAATGPTPAQAPRLAGPMAAAP